MLTETGRTRSEVCRLDRPRLTEFRRRLFELVRLLPSHPDPGGSELFRSYFDWPQHLPDLAALRPPNGNQRPPGIAQSYHALRERGQLAGTLPGNQAAGDDS